MLFGFGHDAWAMAFLLGLLLGAALLYTILRLTAREKPAPPNDDYEETQRKVILYSIFNTQKDLVLVTRADGMVIFMNQAAINQFGDFIGSSCRQVLRCPPEQCRLCRLQHSAPTETDTEQASLPWELTVKGRLYDLSVAPIPEDREGRSLILAHDITDRKLLERHLLLNEKLLSLGQLVAGIAHEINNPLTFITNNLEIILLIGLTLSQYLERLELLVELAASTDDPLLKEACRSLAEWREDNPAYKQVYEMPLMLKDIQDGTRRITRFVRDLKEFSHQGTNAPERVELNALLERCLRLVRHDLKKNIRVTTQLNDVPAIWGYPQALEQVFLNLIINAIHAMRDREEGHLHIETTVAATDVCIRVEDNGSGIPKDVQARIFEPFFTTKSVGEGTGLGLAIVKRIVRQHGGNVDLKSEVGKGTTFTLCIPKRIPGANDELDVSIYAP